jgi:hypothetical protein
LKFVQYLNHPVTEVGMAASLTIRVNDQLHEVTADPDTPLLS